MEDQRETDSSEGEQDLTTISAHATSASEVEISFMVVTLEVPARVEEVGLSSMVLLPLMRP